MCVASVSFGTTDRRIIVLHTARFSVPLPHSYTVAFRYALRAITYAYVRGLHELRIALKDQKEKTLSPPKIGEHHVQFCKAVPLVLHSPVKK